MNEPATRTSGEKLSVIMELENAGWAGRRRALAALRACSRQLEQCADRLVESASFVVAYDPEDWEREQVDRILEEGGIAEAVDRIRRVVRPDADYFGLKNEAAAAADGDVLVLLDSDVIPEEGWLRALLEALDDPEVEVVGSHCYIDGEDLVSRTYGLFHVFPLRTERFTGSDHPSIPINSLAIRSEVIEEHPLPDLPLYRNSAHLWKKRLRRAGVRIHYRSEARVAHPAPPGLQAMLRWSTADGHDLYTSRRHAENRPWPLALLLALAGDVRRIRLWTVRLFRRDREAELGFARGAAAAAICLATHAARVAGCLASFVRGGRPPARGRGWLSLRAGTSDGPS